MSRVVLRAVTPEDEQRRRLWQSDDELRRLAPSVGELSTMKNMPLR